jgi:NAD(P)-dependent dehydrogenase (short-subunit alcohol dehydrogenase family)
MDLGIKGKVALVLASSRGLGQAMAVSLAKEGVKVAVTGRSPVRAHRVGGNTRRHGKPHLEQGQIGK